VNSEIVNGEIASQHISLTPHPSPLALRPSPFFPIFAYVIKTQLMTFKQVLLASCALVISATAAIAQIPSYVPTNGLVGWWPFNGNANDESGNGNDGVVNGATLTEDRSGVANAAYSFDGNSNINVSNAFFNNGGTAYSLVLWVNLSAINSSNTLVHTNPYCGFGLGYIYLGNNKFYHYKGPDPYNTTSMSCWSIFNQDLFNSDSFFQGEWIQISIVKISDDYYYYLNGELDKISNATLSPLEANCSLIFGTLSNGSEGMTGRLDDIAIYNRALTPQEIQNLYNGTTETVDTGNGAAPLPQGIPYQAAARDVQGQVIADAPVNVRFTLHEGAADGAASYAETHALTTNSVGLFNTVFGAGTPEQSTFDSINWAATTKFLQVEIDLGEGYVDMGTTQLLSVPYALRSDEAARVKNAGLPIFNDNAAALAGGLVAGEMYRTAAGVLMVAY
jgi:hypothetical protein